MSLEKGRITGAQMTTLVIGFIVGSASLLPPGALAGNDAWVAVLIGLAEALLISLVFISISRRFPGKTFVEISREVFGPLLGTLFALLYLWFLLHIGSLVILDFCNFVNMAILPQTPYIVIMGFLVLVTASAVRNGIEVIGRLAQLLVPLALLSIPITLILASPKMELSNFQPVLSTPLPKLLWAGHRAAVFPLLESVAFLMVLPFLNRRKEIALAYWKGLIIAALVLAIGAGINTAILGSTQRLFLFPAYEVSRIINIGEIFTRLDLLAVLNLVAMGFLQLAVLFYGVCLGTAQLCNLKTYLPVVLPTGILLGTLCLLNFSNVPQATNFANSAAPFYHPIFEVLLPCFLLVWSLLRKKSGPAK